jgi:hypothetical protein
VSAGQEADQYTVHDVLLPDNNFGNLLPDAVELRDGTLQKGFIMHNIILEQRDGLPPRSPYTSLQDVQ